MDTPAESPNKLAQYFEFMVPSLFIQCQKEIEDLYATGILIGGEVRRIERELNSQFDTRFGTDFVIKTIQKEGLKRYVILLENYHNILSKGIRV